MRIYISREIIGAISRRPDGKDNLEPHYMVSTYAPANRREKDYLVLRMDLWDHIDQSHACGSAVEIRYEVDKTGRRIAHGIEIYDVVSPYVLSLLVALTNSTMR